MANDVMVSARVEPKVKEQVEEIFSKIGVSMSQAIKMFLETAKFALSRI